MTWYGLTMEDAAARCASMGLQARFCLTQDPKAAPVVLSDLTEEGCSMPGYQPGALKVIRVTERQGVADILLGVFAQERESAYDGT